MKDKYNGILHMNIRNHPLYCIVCKKCYSTIEGYNNHLTRAQHKKKAVNALKFYLKYKPELVKVVKKSSVERVEEKKSE